jgi:hypothetical protein
MLDSFSIAVFLLSADSVLVGPRSESDGVHDKIAVRGVLVLRVGVS